MRFVVGIGNPGKKYEKTRHNAGFAVLDAVAGSVSWKDRKKIGSRVAELGSATLVKPQTFVNKTGEALSAIVKVSGAVPGDFLIVCDDVNLDLGKLRLRREGSAGGHHGLESAIEALGSEAFARLRVGVRTASMPHELADYVLAPFGPGESAAAQDAIEGASRVCEVWIHEGFEAAQAALSRYQSNNKGKKESV